MAGSDLSPLSKFPTAASVHSAGLGRVSSPSVRIILSDPLSDRLLVSLYLTN